MPTLGLIFEIREFCLHDGPGIRTTVFLKGCPLRCLWCQNPEGFEHRPQLLVSTRECIGCNECKQVCTHSASPCVACGKCVQVCPQGCRRICGTWMKPDELAEKLLKDKELLQESNGGITFSGGEPLMQYQFLQELIPKLKPLHLAIETSGYAEQHIYKDVASSVNLVFQDIKHTDDATHRRLTGVGNQQILKNLDWLATTDIPFVVRVPLIPGLTDQETNFEALAERLENAKNLEQVQLLPYNPAAGAKYKMMNLDYKPPFDMQQQPNTDLTPFQKRNLPCKVM
ncbi:MAG: glycyl-radical enzyme activating protein [Lentisphaerae bacterium]|nr:glycyl-radical enzyme activating protein [Lentisphaerota bacterium]